MVQSFLTNPVEWEQQLTEKVKSDPTLARKLAEVMWLDQFLMDAIQAQPDKEYPEMRQAWELCIQIAREIGIPEDAGADWLSYQATPIGKRLGIMPSSGKTA